MAKPSPASMKQLQSELLKVLGKYPGLSVFVSITSNNGYGLYVGNGCVVCAIKEAVLWMVDNNIKHEDGTSELDNVILIPPTSETVN